MRIFDRLAAKSAKGAGSSLAFVLAFGTVLVWAATGPLFDYSPTWQLLINTGTTITTFLLVFLLQHSQNVKDKAMHAKLDEILRAIPEADNKLRGIEQKEEC